MLTISCSDSGTPPTCARLLLDDSQAVRSSSPVDQPGDRDENNYPRLSSSSYTKVVNNTIAKDLDDINKKVKDASMGLRRERIRLIKIKAKEITGQDIELEAADIDTDVNVEVHNKFILESMCIYKF